MTERVMFVDGVAYSEADMAAFQSKMRPDGVLMDSVAPYTGFLAVNAPGGMNVQVGSGELMIQGFLYQNDANKTLGIAANSSGSTRVDLVVVRLDRAANTCIAQIKQGTPGAGAPALTQTPGGTWEAALSQVTVASGAVSIVAGNIVGLQTKSLWPVSTLDTAVALDTDVAALDPAIAKAWGHWIAAGPGLVSSFGITSVTNPFTGRYTVTMSRAMASANSYAVIASMNSADIRFTVTVTTLTTTTFEVRIYDASGVLENSSFSFVVFGTLA